MNIEIPKEDGWYWLKRKGYGIKMSCVFTMHDVRMVSVYGMHSPTSLTIYHTPDELGEFQFVKIERPQ